MLKKIRTVGGAALAVAALGAFGSPALSWASSPITAIASDAGKEPAAPGKTSEERLANRNDHFAALATKLGHGLTADDVAAAERAVLSDRLDKAVADGKITEAQKQDALAAWDNASLHDFRRKMRKERRGATQEGSTPNRARRNQVTDPAGGSNAASDAPGQDVVFG